MFTGLIVETGTIVSVERLRAAAAGTKSGGALTRITVAAAGVPAELSIGDSVAVSGVCLTAVEIGSDRFSADLAQETLERTSLGGLKQGSLVNLELPARAQDRLGGHVVQGHVDGVGSLVRLDKVAGGEDWRLALEIPQALRKYVVLQGSITVEGISLTVAAITAGKIEIAIIPHTYQSTNLRALATGNPLNIEVDVLAKYAEKMAKDQKSSKISVAVLIQRGF